MLNTTALMFLKSVAGQMQLKKTDERIHTGKPNSSIYGGNGAGFGL